MAKTIAFLGGPGSGKDTQIDFLEKNLGYTVISTGDLARQKEKEDPGVREIIRAGKLVDDQTVATWLKEAIEKTGNQENLVVNGFPRDIKQASMLEDILASNGRKLDEVIYLEVPEEVMIKRLTSRAYCNICGKKVLMKINECEKCGGTVEKREDDTLETIKKRIKIFKESTLPLVEFYKTKMVLRSLNGGMEVNALSEKIKQELS